MATGSPAIAANDEALTELGFGPIAGAPFGVQSHADLRRPLAAEAVNQLVEAYRRHKLLHFSGQKLTRAEQEAVLAHIGPVLMGDAPEIAIDGTLGDSALAYHSDLAFTPEPIETLSLHALDVEDGQTVTHFANGVLATQRLPAALRRRIEPLQAVTVMATVQSARALPAPLPDILPRQEWDVLISHPVTGEDILYVGEMQTAHVSGLAASESEALLQDLFAILYADEAVYRHRWRAGDLLIWDNLALQHGRPDLGGVTRRRLQRACVARHTFDELLPGLRMSDPRILALGRGRNFTMN